jgi:membrane fusion protein, multidrug efflux system
MKEDSGKRARRKPFIALGAVVGALLLGILCYAVATWGEEATDDAQIEADVVPLGPRIGGLVRDVYVVDNQAVKRGDPILQLDDADQLAKLAQAQAELATAQAQADASRAQEQVIIASARGGYSSAKALVVGSSVAVFGAQAQITAAQAALARAQAEARKAALDWSRTQELEKSGAISRQQYDAAQAVQEASLAALAQAQANLSATEEQRRAAESHVAEAEGKLAQSSPIDAQIAAAHGAALLAEARVQSAQAALTLAELQLSYTKITASTDGVISKLAAHVGQLLSVGQPIAELVPNDSYVVANFKETQIQKMHSGERADVDVDAYPHRPLVAKVESLSGGTGARFSLLPPDNASGNFVKVVQRVPVRLTWVNPPSDLPLRAGLSASVTVHLDSK